MLLLCLRHLRPVDDSELVNGQCPVCAGAEFLAMRQDRKVAMINKYNVAHLHGVNVPFPYKFTRPWVAASPCGNTEYWVNCRFTLVQFLDSMTDVKLCPICFPSQEEE